MPLDALAASPRSPFERGDSVRVEELGPQLRLAGGLGSL
jgi:hypothetical protein